MSEDANGHEDEQDEKEEEERERKPRKRGSHVNRGPASLFLSLCLHNFYNWNAPIGIKVVAGGCRPTPCIFLPSETQRKKERSRKREREKERERPNPPGCCCCCCYVHDSSFYYYYFFFVPPLPHGFWAFFVESVCVRESVSASVSV